MLVSHVGINNMCDIIRKRVLNLVIKAQKKIGVFPIAWSSKLGSVGWDCFVFFFETYKYAPSSKIMQTSFFLSYYSLLII
jgi:hypothetical protein